MCGFCFLQVDQATLYDITMAADYLYIKKLFDFACKTYAKVIKYNSVEGIRRFFDVENDLSSEEQ